LRIFWLRGVTCKRVENLKDQMPESRSTSISSIILWMIVSACITSLIYEVFRVQTTRVVSSANLGTTTEEKKQTFNNDEELWKDPSNPKKKFREVFFERALEDYIKLHNEIMTGKRPPRFAKGDVGHGWGNIFQMATSYLMYGMITGRAVVFYPVWAKGTYFFTNFDDFFERPPIDVMHFPKDLFSRYNNGMTHFRGYPEAVVCKNLSEDQAAMVDLTSPGLYDFWAPSLITQYQSHLSGKIPSNWFSILVKRIFRPKKDIQEFVEQFKRNHFGEYNVGLQMRVWMGKYGTDSVVLPRVPLDVFLQAADVLASGYPVTADKVNFFFATTEKDYVTEGIKIYGEKKIMVVPEEDPDASTVNGTKMGLIVMLLLGECDDIITTEVSSYGTNAAAMAGIKPHMCTHERLCYQRLSEEACAFTPYPIISRKCNKDGKSVYLPGVQSTCAYFSRQIFSRKWYDFYDSWRWNPSYVNWNVGDDNGRIVV